MSDIEQLQTENEALTAEVEKLRAKNSELLDELKQAKASRATGALQEQVQALESDKQALQAELKEIKTKDAWQAMYAAAGIDLSMAKYFRLEFEESGFGIDLDDEGEPVIVDAEGRPVPEVEVLKNGLERETGRYLRPDDPLQVGKLSGSIRNERPGLWPRPVGSGAPGSNSTRVHRPKVEDEPKQEPAAGPKFGIR